MAAHMESESNLQAVVCSPLLRKMRIIVESNANKKETTRKLTGNAEVPTSLCGGSLSKTAQPPIALSAFPACNSLTQTIDLNLIKNWYTLCGL